MYIPGYKFSELLIPGSQVSEVLGVCFQAYGISGLFADIIYMCPYMYISIPIYLYILT